MEMQPTNRTVRPDAEAIKRLRLEKGWRVEDLAKKAICSVRTLDNIEKGASVYMNTLSKIANALDVEYKTLLPGGEPPAEPPRPEPRVQVQITFAIPFAQFDESKQLGGLIEFLKKFMKGGGDVDVLGVEPGSTIITLEMNVEDMNALLSAYKKGKLAEIHCTELRLSHAGRFGVDDIRAALDLLKKIGNKNVRQLLGEDFTPSKIGPPRRKGKKHKPDTEQ